MGKTGLNLPISSTSLGGEYKLRGLYKLKSKEGRLGRRRHGSAEGLNMRIYHNLASRRLIFTLQEQLLNQTSFFSVTFVHLLTVLGSGCPPFRPLVPSARRFAHTSRILALCFAALSTFPFPFWPSSAVLLLLLLPVGGGPKSAEGSRLMFATVPFLAQRSPSSPSYQSSQTISFSSGDVLGPLGLISSWGPSLRPLSRPLVASMASNSVFQADSVALAAEVADWSSSVDRREGFLSRARRVAVWRLRSGKRVRWGRDAVVESEVVASTMLGENLVLPRLDMDAFVVLRDVVGVGRNVAASGGEEMVAGRPAETLAPCVDEAGLVVVIAILAPVFSSDIVALFERLLY